MPVASQMENWIDVAMKYVGHPSKRYQGPDMGNTSEWFDCSGFVQYTLLEAGIPLMISPTTGSIIRHTEEFFDFFGVTVQSGLERRGDLVFFSRNGFYPTHLGFVISPEMYLHAPGKDGTTVREAELKREIIEICEVQTKQPIYHANPIGFKRPTLIIPETRRQEILDLEDL